ncbi:hypothetical protein Q7C36_002115 [Tachysurus vachellii]|uniref:Uncharacterized protein n=1 Tax=Tachysurus vachellii TaxID=175792 RepID=A0AA88T8K8_TACVA|nr:hypothetical protein Q7C36_002115 [Tachysurus vachellii]
MTIKIHQQKTCQMEKHSPKKCKKKGHHQSDPLSAPLYVLPETLVGGAPGEDRLGQYEEETSDIKHPESERTGAI